MSIEKSVWKNGMMEYWNIGLKKRFLLLNIIPSFQHSIIPELLLALSIQIIDWRSEQYHRHLPYVGQSIGPPAFPPKSEIVRNLCT